MYISVLTMFLAIFSMSRKGGIIYEQMKRLGSSLDWQRATFTMDEVYLFIYYFY